MMPVDIFSAEFSVFLAAAIVLAVTPGPGIAYVVARTAAGGRAEGMMSTFGTALGGLVHVVAAALGISLLIAQSATLFVALKYAGAAYLVYLGLRQLLSKPPAQEDGAPRVRSVGARRAFWEGVAVEALNVKTALFFLAFIPQFVDPAQPALGQFVMLGCICVSLNTLADVIAVTASSRLMEAGARRRRERALSAGSGVCLVGLGAYVALASGER